MEKTMTKSKKLVLISAVFAGILCLTAVIIPMLREGAEIQKKTDEYMRHTVVKSFNIQLSSQDSLLFNPAEIGKLQLRLHATSDLRNDIKQFVYNRKGVIFYTTIDLNTDRPYDDVIFTDNRKTPEAEVRMNYSIMDLGLKKYESVDSIICNYVGDVEKMRAVIYSPDFRCYTLPTVFFTLRYGENEPADISFRGGLVVTQPKIPVSFTFAFLKRQDKVFFIVYLPHDYKQRNRNNEMDCEFLGSIINWKNDEDDAIDNE